MKPSNSHLSLFASLPRSAVRLTSNLLYLLGYLFSVGKLFLAISRILKSLSQRLAITPRDDDIFIVSYPRSGTTWLQMIVYQLTSDGEMGFQHISEVVPFLERTPVWRRDMDALPAPRRFKTHLGAEMIDTRRGRFIYISRSPFDVAQSYFGLYAAYKKHSGSLEHMGPAAGDFDAFVDRFVNGRVMYGSWRKHVEGWRMKAAQPNVLWLTYEEMAGDLSGAAERIAAFLNVELSALALERVKARCHFEFMKRHEAKFEPSTEFLWESGFIAGEFIREGKVGASQDRLTPEQRRKLAAMDFAPGWRQLDAAAPEPPAPIPLRRQART